MNFKPDWDLSPTWAKWCAIDGDGEITWFESKPELNDAVWETVSGQSEFFDDLNEPFPDDNIESLIWSRYGESIDHCIENFRQMLTETDLCLSIDPEGYNVYDLLTEKQVSVDHIDDVIKIIDTRREYIQQMNRWNWL